MRSVIADHQIFLGEDIPIDRTPILIHQPTISEIWRQGEDVYFSAVDALTAIPSDAKAPLADIGINYMEISDFDFFMLMAKGIKTERITSLITGFDFDSAAPKIHRETKEPVLVDKNNSIIDRYIRHQISETLCKLHGFKKTPEIAANEFTLEFLIDEDRERRAFKAMEEKKSALLPIVTCIAVRFCSLDVVLNMTYYQAREIMRRIQMYDRSMTLLQGIYAGNVDAKKINKKELDWTR